MGSPAARVVRRWANRLLPRPVVELVARIPARHARRRRLARLDHAVDDFDRAYTHYWRTGEVPTDAEELLFLATWASGGSFTQERSRGLGSPFLAERFLGFADDLLRGVRPEAVARGIEAEGFYVADSLIPDDVVSNIRAVLDAGPAQPRGDGLGVPASGAPQPTAPTWWMRPEEAIKAEGVRRLLGERGLPMAAGHYLGVDPMIMSIALWTSFAWSRADKTSAQHFHYDSDRAGFVKMFVYLTDVATSNGPHVYVRGSHRTKPAALLHGERLSDDAVRAFYPEDTWVEITGPRGTFFFADTHGLHKGGRVIEDKRSILQINVGTDRFGTYEAPIGSHAGAPDDLARVVATAPRYFSQIFTPERLVP